MAYSVYAVAAAEFMAVFYERLFAGNRVADAVTAGRARLRVADKRPSPKGELPLADWVVPVHYALTQLLGPETLDQTWHAVTGNPIPPHVRTHATTPPAEGHDV
jgi:hypothetical protein